DLVGWAFRWRRLLGRPGRRALGPWSWSGRLRPSRKWTGGPVAEDLERVEEFDGIPLVRLDPGAACQHEKHSTRPPVLDQVEPLDGETLRLRLQTKLPPRMDAQRERSLTGDLGIEHSFEAVTFQGGCGGQVEHPCRDVGVGHRELD